MIDSLQRDQLDSRDAEVEGIAGRFQQLVEDITAGNGIHLTRDDQAPVQAGFVVPNLGITIVPLVYGDHHSWNLAYLGGEKHDVPTHRHHFGVEIHLGFPPTHGETVLGAYRAKVEEGYAMPIPPEIDHGWRNTSGQVHHVPFIFGSRKYSGWGIFLDVIAQARPVEECTTPVSWESPAFSQMIHLERRIAQAEKMASCWRTILIPHSVTNRQGVGGLELSLARINASGFQFPEDDFRAVGVVRGEGVVNMAGIQQPVSPHDHFGIPSGMRATLKQVGPAPLVTLDATIRGY